MTDDNSHDDGHDDGNDVEKEAERGGVGRVLWEVFEILCVTVIIIRPLRERRDMLSALNGAVDICQTPQCVILRHSMQTITGFHLGIKLH